MATKAEAAAPGKGGAAEEAVIHRIRITLTSRCLSKLGSLANPWMIRGVGVGWVQTQNLGGFKPEIWAKWMVLGIRVILCPNERHPVGGLGVGIGWFGGFESDSYVLQCEWS